MERKIEVGEIVFRDSPTREMFACCGFSLLSIWPTDKNGVGYDSCRLANLSDCKTAEEAKLFEGRWVELTCAGGNFFREKSRLGKFDADFWPLPDIAKRRGNACVLLLSEKTDARLLPLSYKPEESIDWVKVAKEYGAPADPVCDCGKREGEAHAKNCAYMADLIRQGYWFCECGCCWGPKDDMPECLNCKRKRPSKPEELKPLKEGSNAVARWAKFMGKMESVPGTPPANANGNSYAADALDKAMRAYAGFYAADIDKKAMDQVMEFMDEKIPDPEEGPKDHEGDAVDVRAVERGDVNYPGTHIYDGKDWRALPGCDCGKREGERHAKDCTRMKTFLSVGWQFCECGEILQPRQDSCPICKREKRAEMVEVPEMRGKDGADGPDGEKGGKGGSLFIRIPDEHKCSHCGRVVFEEWVTVEAVDGSAYSGKWAGCLDCYAQKMGLARKIPEDVAARRDRREWIDSLTARPAPKKRAL